MYHPTGLPQSGHPLLVMFASNRFDCKGAVGKHISSEFFPAPKNGQNYNRDRMLGFPRRGIGWGPTSPQLRSFHPPAGAPEPCSRSDSSSVEVTPLGKLRTQRKGYARPRPQRIAHGWSGPTPPAAPRAGGRGCPRHGGPVGGVTLSLDASTHRQGVASQLQQSTNAIQRTKPRIGIHLWGEFSCRRENVQRKKKCFNGRLKLFRGGNGPCLSILFFSNDPPPKKTTNINRKKF